MGASPSKRVSQTLLDSPEFNSACNSVFDNCLSAAQFAFPGIKPYQLFSATQQLHGLLLDSVQLIKTWVPSPPARSQVDRAYKDIIAGRVQDKGEEEDSSDVLQSNEFRAYAAEVFTNAVVSGAGKEILKMLSVGIVGVLAGSKANLKVVGAAIGASSIVVASSIFLGLGS